MPGEWEKKWLTEDRKWWGALQSVKLLLQPPPEVDLLKQNLLELLWRRRNENTRERKRKGGWFVRNAVCIHLYGRFIWEEWGFFFNYLQTVGLKLKYLPFSMFSTSFFSGTGEAAPWLRSPENIERLHFRCLCPTYPKVRQSILYIVAPLAVVVPS